jgi:hypothetical protein
MTSFDPHELSFDLDPGERAELSVMAERLLAMRPVPRAAFRGELRRSLLGRGAAPARPRWLRARVTAYVVSGAALLAIAGIGAAGAGPLAPPSSAASTNTALTASAR